MKTVKLRNNRTVGTNHKPYFIAELNTSHFGELSIAKDMIKTAKEIGCDCVKFQSWTDETLYSKSFYEENSIAKRFIQKYSLSEDELTSLLAYCDEINIDFASTPYSKSEVDFLVDKTSAPFIKVASMDLNNLLYLEYIGKKSIPIILSTGMGTFEEVERAVQTIEKTGNKDIIILHCVSIYPASTSILNLNNIKTLHEIFEDYPIGYSDHSVGVEMAPISIALGASVIEKHFTLDKSKIGMDNQMAMEPDEFKRMIDYCLNVYEALGEKKRVLSKSEVEQRSKMRRSIIFSKSLKKGSKIKEEDLDMKRPGTGIPPDQIDDIIGKTLIEDVEEDTLVHKNVIA